MSKSASDILRDRIKDIPDMLYFKYNGKDGDIEIWWDDIEAHTAQYRLTYNGELLAAPPSANELMQMPLFDGKTLEDIAEQMDIEEG